MTVKPNREIQKLEVTSRPTKCKHYYFYYNAEEFGLMYLKIQTWFPYNVQIYINGREYLLKILDKNNIKYEIYNNSFSYIETGFNLLNNETLKLLQTISNGKYLITGLLINPLEKKHLIKVTLSI